MLDGRGKAKHHLSTIRIKHAVEPVPLETIARAVNRAQCRQTVERDLVRTQTHDVAVLLVQPIDTACPGSTVVLISEPPFCQGKYFRTRDRCQRGGDKVLVCLDNGIENYEGYCDSHTAQQQPDLTHPEPEAID